MSKQRRKFFERARECINNHEILGEISGPDQRKEHVQPSDMYGESALSFEWFSEYDHQVFTEIRMGMRSNLYTSFGRVYTICMSFTSAWDEHIERSNSCDSIDQLPGLLDQVYHQLRWEILRDAVDSGQEILA